MEAARKLGWKEIPVTVIDVEDLLSAERDENAERKDFTPTEAVAIGKLIEEQHRAKIEAQRHEQAVHAGKVRQGTASDGPKYTPAGKTEDVVGRAVGMSRMRYYRARAVVAAADAERGRVRRHGDDVRELRGDLRSVCADATLLQRGGG